MNTKTFLLITILTLTGSAAKSQFADSIKIEIGAIGTYASENYQPLWASSNKFGTIADRKSDVSANVSVSNIHRYKTRQHSDTSNRPWYISYGANIYANQHFAKAFAEEAYLKAGFKNWQFRAGRFNETTGDLDYNTSSGSLGISGNALPIPKIGFAVTDYIPVPFTNSFVKFKGQISHGWFGNNRYMKDAFYHEKIFYLQLGKKKFKLYGGVQHFVEWGGRRGSVQLERSLKGFIDVLFVRAADDGSVGTANNGILPNRPGDQRGLFEAGFKYENDKMLLNGYQQTPFETGRDVNIRNVDRLVGLTLYSKQPKSILQKLTLELLYTYNMLNFVPQFDRQSYYNNGYYKTGWEYEDRIVGTPLFINRVRASKYFSAYTPYNWNAPDNTITGNDNIVNNRVVALHLGSIYKLGSQLEGKTLLTYTLNYGTYNSTSPFVPHKKQLYTLQQFNYHLNKAGIQLMAGIAIDNGEMSDNTGIMLGIKKQFSGYNLFK